MKDSQIVYIAKKKEKNLGEKKGKKNYRNLISFSLESVSFYVFHFLLSKKKNQVMKKRQLIYIFFSFEQYIEKKFAVKLNNMNVR